MSNPSVPASPSTPSHARAKRRTPLAITISAWAVPVLVVGQFALVAAIPVVILLIGTLQSTRARALRWWAGLVALAYAIPLALWLLRPDAAPSLSKDIHPVFVVLIVAAAAVLIAKIIRRRRPTLVP